MGGNGGFWPEESPAKCWQEAMCGACKKRREELARLREQVKELEADLASRGVPNRRMLSALTYDVAVLRRENADLREQLRDVSHVRDLREEIERLRAHIERDAQHKADEMELRRPPSCCEDISCKGCP